MKKCEINLLISIFITYIFFIILNDYLVFTLKIEGLVSYCVSFIFTIALVIFLRRYFKIKIDNFNKIDIMLIVFLLCIFGLRIAIPDSAFDTLNYHVYLQKNAFSDNVNYNFFPARWINTFSFPLSDRLHNFFRIIFGYRLGMFFNGFCAIVIYYQIKRLLKMLIKNNNLVCILSIIIILTEQIMSNMITYYVDIFNIPIILEIILIILERQNINNNSQNFYVLFLAGILVALKVSNAFFLIPLAIIYIIRYKKSINYKTFLFGFIIFIIPILVYVLNIYIQTGNPVFPFYNSIFKSKYLENSNWIESFYGPKNLLERLFWPIYTIFEPRRAFDTEIYYGRIGFGYIVSILVFIIYVIKIIKDKKIKNLDFIEFMSCIYIILCLFWSNFMMGYIRYALSLEILSGIICIIFICKYYEKLFILSLCTICSLSFTFMNTISDIYRTPTELSWRYPYSLNKLGFEKNFDYILNKSWNYSDYLEGISCIGISDYNSGYAVLLGVNVPIININEAYNNEFGELKYHEALNKCENIYTISTTWTYDRTNNYVTKAGFTNKGDKRVFKADFLNIENDIILFKIEKENGGKNEK